MYLFSDRLNLRQQGLACCKPTRAVSTIQLDWSEIVGSYNTAKTVVRDERMK